MKNVIILLLISFLYTNIQAQTAQVFKRTTSVSGGGSLDEVAEDDKVEANSLNTLPNLIATNSPFRVIPDIKIVTSNTKFNKNIGRIHNLKIFTSGTNFDTSTVQNGFNYLIPEASKLGAQYSFTRAFKTGNKDFSSSDSKPLLVHFNLGFLSKEIPGFEKDSIVVNGKNILAIHSDLGLEWLFVKDFLSAYANVNVIGTGSGVKEFVDYFDLKVNKAFWFLEYGLRAEFITGENKDNVFSLNLGFIHNGGDIHPFTVKEDVFLPNIRIAFTKIFDFDTSSDSDDDELPNPNNN